jgi:hypothetical protein
MDGFSAGQSWVLVKAHRRHAAGQQDRHEGSQVACAITRSVSLKLYDKFGLILRIETTVNDLTFCKR